MKIPTYDNYQESPGTGPSPNVRATPSPDVAGAQLEQAGKAMSNAGQVASSIATDMQKDVNEANTKKADNLAAEAIRTTVIDYTNRLGEDAVNGAKDARKALDDGIKAAGFDLTNDTQRRLFSDVAARRLNTAMGQVDNHAAQQTKIFHAGQSAARLDNFQQDAILNKNNPQLLAQAKKGMEAEAAAVAKSIGKGDEVQTKDLQDKARTQLHTAIIQSFVSEDNSTAARAYFNANKGEINAAQHDEIKKVLDVAGVKDDSMAGLLALRGKPYAEQIASADAQYAKGKISVEVHDALMTRIDHAEGQRAAKERENVNSNLGAAQEWILRHPTQPITDLPPELYSWAKDKAHLDDLVKFAVYAGRPPSNPALFTELRMQAVDDPVAFMNRVRQDPSILQMNLAPEEYNAVVGLASSVSKQDLKATDDNKKTMTIVGDVKTELESLGFDTTPNANKAKADMLLGYTSSVIKAVDAATAEKGGSLTTDERKKIALDLLKKGRLQDTGFFSDTKVLRYQDQKDAAHPFIVTPFSEIPEISRERIEQAVRSNPSKFGLTESQIPAPGVVNSTFKNTIESVYQNAVDAGVAE